MRVKYHQNIRDNEIISHIVRGKRYCLRAISERGASRLKFTFY